MIKNLGDNFYKVVLFIYTQCKNLKKNHVHVGTPVTCACESFPFDSFRESRSPRKVSLFSRVSCLRPLPPAVRSRSSLYKPKLVVFPLRSVATRDDSMYGTDGHETRRLGAESRPDKPRDSLVRDGVTRRVREAAIFIIRRPPRFARVLPHLSDGSAVSLSRITDSGLGGHEEERPRNSVEGNSDLGAQREISTFVPTPEESGGRRFSRERRNISSACGDTHFSVYVKVSEFY